MKTLNHFQKSNMSKTQQGIGIAIGLALGAGIGTATQNIAAGVGAGLLLGIVIDFMCAGKDANGEVNTDNLKENVGDW